MTTSEKPHNTNYLRQQIVCRKDLHMPTGKVAAMVAHAAMSFIVNSIRKEHTIELTEEEKQSLGLTDEELTKGNKYGGAAIYKMYFNNEQARWMTELDPGLEEQGQVSFAKIVLEVYSEQELLDVEQKAKEHNLEVHRVVDSGYSHNKPGTLVCIAIGPDWPEKLKPVTGHLKVYR